MASMLLCPPQRFIELFMGPLALGSMFGTLIFGMLIVQMFWYHVNFPQDRVSTRLVAWFSFFLSATFTAFSIGAAWNQFGKNWGNCVMLVLIDRIWIGLPPINGILALTSQLYFAWRNYQMVKNVWLSILIACLSVLQFAMTIYYSAWVLAHGVTWAALLNMKVYVDVWLCGSLACDLLITSTVLTILVRARHETTYKPTLATLNKIIKFTMEAGLVTSIWAVIQLFLWMKEPTKGFHLFFFMNRGRLYSNWLLTTLNSRSYITRNHRAVIDVTKLPPGPTTWTNVERAKLNAFEDLSATINVKTTTEVHDDGHELVVVPSTAASCA